MPKKDNNSKPLKRKIKWRDRRLFYSLIAVGLVTSVVMIILISGKILRIRQLDKEQTRITREIQQETEKKESLEEQINYSNTVEYVEKQARENLKMVKQDESVYIERN